MKTLLSAFLLSGVTLLLPQGASALEMDFQGFNIHSQTVQNQPEGARSLWIGASDWLKAEKLASSENVVLAWPELPPSKQSSQRLALTDAKGVPYPASGKYSFSFDIRSVSVPAKDGFDSQQRIILGGQIPANLQPAFFVLTVFSNGRLGLTTEQTEFTVKDYTGKAYDLDDYDHFITLSGVVDFDTMTYCLDVDGAPQVSEGKRWFGFSGKREQFIDAGKLDIVSPRSVPDRPLNYRRLQMDNIKFEPYQ